MAVRSASSTVRDRQARARARARQEILQAAAGVFARRGYAASTLADLAQAAGYAAPSLYRYFGSKEEIFGSLLDLLRQELDATFAAPVDPAHPTAARLEALVRAQFELVRTRREVFAVFVAERPELGSGKAPLATFRAGLTLYEQRLTEWLRRHVGRRELRTTPERASRALTGMVHAFHQCQLTPDAPPFEPAEQARLVVDLALHGFAAATRPGADHH